MNETGGAVEADERDGGSGLGYVSPCHHLFRRQCSRSQYVRAQHRREDLERTVDAGGVGLALAH